MYFETEKIEKAKDMMGQIANGMNPLSGEQLLGDNLLSDAGMVRCFYFVTEVLDDILKVSLNGRNKITTFVITPEQKNRVVLPDNPIGVNEFSRCINACLNLNESKKLTGVELNRKLKKLGVLSEEVTEEGKRRTIINQKSAEYGFETERKSYNGVEYDKIVMNAAGKKYLLDNIETIMATNEGKENN